MKLANLKAAFLAVAALVLAGILAVGEFVYTGFAAVGKAIVTASATLRKAAVTGLAAATIVFAAIGKRVVIAVITAAFLSLAMPAFANKHDGPTPHKGLSFGKGAGIAEYLAEGTISEAKLLYLIKSDKHDINARDKDGESALYRALSYQSWVLQIIIEAGADVNARNKNGWSPLGSLAYFISDNHPRIDDKLKMVDLLIAAGADINAKNKYGETAAYAAKDEGNYKVLARLKSAGGKAKKDSSGNLVKGILGLALEGALAYGKAKQSHDDYNRQRDAEEAEAQRRRNAEAAEAQRRRNAEVAEQNRQIEAQNAAAEAEAKQRQREAEQQAEQQRRENEKRQEIAALNASVKQNNNCLQVHTKYSGKVGSSQFWVVRNFTNRCSQPIQLAISYWDQNGFQDDDSIECDTDTWSLKAGERTSWGWANFVGPTGFNTKGWTSFPSKYSGSRHQAFTYNDSISGSRTKAYKIVDALEKRGMECPS